MFILYGYIKIFKNSIFLLKTKKDVCPKYITLNFRYFVILLINYYSMKT